MRCSFSRVFSRSKWLRSRIVTSSAYVTFVTKIGPLEVKCNFTLGDMIYRGILEL